MATIAGTAAREINRIFNQIANNVVSYFNTMATRSAASFTIISNAAKAAATTINNAIQTAANNALQAISQLGTKSAAAFQTMANNATKVADAIKQIGSAASSAASEVNALASAVNSVPTNKTITFHIQTVGSIPSVQKGTGGMVFMAGGGAATGNRKAIVGETNDEMVTRTGLRTGSVSSQMVTSMKTINNLGLHEPEMLQVTPTRGYYAQRFKERLGLGGKTVSGVMGGIAGAIKGMFATGGSSYTVPPLVRTSDTGVGEGAGSPNWENVDTSNPDTWKAVKHNYPNRDGTIHGKLLLLMVKILLYSSKAKKRLKHILMLKGHQKPQEHTLRLLVVDKR